MQGTISTCLADPITKVDVNLKRGEVEFGVSGAPRTVPQRADVNAINVCCISVCLEHVCYSIVQTSQPCKVSMDNEYNGQSVHISHRPRRRLDRDQTCCTPVVT